MKPKVARILAAAAEVFAMPVERIVGPDRDGRAIRARQAVMLLAREAGYSLEHIGRRLRRDRSTVHHGSEVAADRLRRDPAYARSLMGMRGRLHGASGAAAAIWPGRLVGDECPCLACRETAHG